MPQRILAPLSSRVSVILGAVIVGAVIFNAGATVSADDPAKSVNELAAGKTLPATWEYSTDDGKTFGPQPPKIIGTRSPAKRSDAARVKFTIDDPSQIGLLKIAMASGRGAFALTSGASVDRYNVGACPTMMDTKITLNGKSTDLGLLPNTLYAYLGVDPTQLNKGENTLQLSGTLWHKNYEKGEVPADIRLEVLPANFVLLDRPPILGMIAPTYFGIVARALIPSTFSVRVTPIEPAGPVVEHSFPRSRRLTTEVPLPAGTKRFSYSVTVKAGGSAKTYGPYEAKLPKTGNGFRFMVAGGTLNRDGGRGIAPLLYAIETTHHPDIFIHTGNYQNCTHWDFIWTDGFWRETQPTFARTPIFAMSSPVELGSPQSFTQSFFFPPDNKDWGHWTVVIGNVRFVAVEAFNESMDKTDGGLKWLEDVLKDAREDYLIVLNSHVTHGSATNYHRVFKQGMDHTAAKIDPLLVKYKVTLAIGSTHRCYERLDPPANESVPTIITGRAGGMGWHIRTDGKPPNTASRKLSGDDHYCVFEVTPEGLKVNVWNFQGQLIDTHVFKPRVK